MSTCLRKSWTLLIMSSILHPTSQIHFFWVQRWSVFFSSHSPSHFPTCTFFLKSSLQGLRYRITEFMYLHRRTEERNLCAWVCLYVSLCLHPRLASTQVCMIDFSSLVPSRQRKPHFKTFLPQVNCVLQRLSSFADLHLCDFFLSPGLETVKNR